MKTYEQIRQEQLAKDEFLRQRGWELLPSGWWAKITDAGTTAAPQEGALAHEGYKQ